jgi:hypothetical protein
MIAYEIMEAVEIDICTVSAWTGHCIHVCVYGDDFIRRYFGA